MLFDKKTKKSVNNESMDVVRMWNTEFNLYSSSKEKINFNLRPGIPGKEIYDLLSWITP